MEALASGCSPSTGEIIPADSVLNERDVIRALQIAIDRLKEITSFPDNTDIEIANEDIKGAIRLFQELDTTPTANRLTGFFLATRTFENPAFSQNKLFGKYEKRYKFGQLKDFFENYLLKNGHYSHERMKEIEPWRNIDFFQKKTFNTLAETAIARLKEQINEIGILKTENIPDYVKTARLNYPRAYEPWTELEKNLLRDALQQTNDIRLLTQCFQRGEGSIISCGKRTIYENQTNNPIAGRSSLGERNSQFQLLMTCKSLLGK